MSGGDEFLRDCRALFDGSRVAHMGAHQYAAHAGQQNGRSMSGSALWARAEQDREDAHGHGRANKHGVELDLAAAVAGEIDRHVPRGTVVVDLGPGTPRAFRRKTLPIMHALAAPRCVVVDRSAAFLRGIASSVDVGDPPVLSVEDDFFLGHGPYHGGDGPALACSFGGTVSNFEAGLCDVFPQAALQSAVASFARAVSSGWLLTAFDADDRAGDIIAYYAAHADFQTNVFYRMAAELPIEGDFDPSVFVYRPVWRAAACQLAHVAVAARAMSFSLAGQRVEIAAGQAFHLKNSFKIPPALFEACCRAEGLRLCAVWSRAGSYAYLLGKADYPME